MNRTNAQANLGGKILQATNRSKNSPCYLSERPCIQRLYEQSKMPSTYLDREEGKGKKENSAMEVESDLILPIYTDTEIFYG